MSNAAEHVRQVQLLGWAALNVLGGIPVGVHQENNKREVVPLKTRRVDG
jgi:hypothetical protein